MLLAIDWRLLWKGPDGWLDLWIWPGTFFGFGMPDFEMDVVLLFITLLLFTFDRFMLSPRSDTLT